VEGLAEGDQPVGARRGAGQLLGQRLDPADVRDPALHRDPPAHGEHRRIGVEPDHLLEQMGEPHREDAGATAGVEEPPAAVQRQLPLQQSLEARRVWRSAAPIMDGRAGVDRGIVRRYRRR
jgi:hypothetical protein